MNGRKRHIVVDTGGLLLRVVVHPADIADRDGIMALVAPLPHQRPRLRHVWVDAAYRGRAVIWLQQALGWSVEVVQKPRHRGWYPVAVEPPPMPTGFRVLPRRWVVERTFAWLGRSRRLSKDYEALPSTGEAWVYLAMTRLMTARLAS